MSPVPGHGWILTIRVDGETVKIGAWLAKARTKHRADQLPESHVRLVAALFDRLDG
ncbi:hypothetical protein ACH4UR_35630 [Streptomyces lydicus]|uniref:hypothetical protein n=1 Tax=Streptomyces lydicus TaxID=47763 RepID=UPI0034069954